MSVTLRFQSSGAVPGDGRPIVMRGPNLTIGRGPENDVVLPDPDRQISKTHCVLENHNGNLVVVDLSTNGTFLNYGKVALGRTATPLNDGDVLILGPYELVVQVGMASAEPVAPLGEDRASFGNAAHAPDPMRLLDDAAPGGDFLDSLLGGPKPKGPGQFRKEDDFSELLPPLGDDGPLLGPAPLPEAGPAMRDNGRTGSDAFRAPQASRSVIPDDWDDLLSPPKPMVPSAAAFSPAPPPPAAVLPIEDDIFAPSPVASSPVAQFPEAPSPVAPSSVAPSPVATPPATLPEDDFLTASPLSPTLPDDDIFAPVSAPEVAPAAAAPFDPFATDPNRPPTASPAPQMAAVVAPPAPEPARVATASASPAATPAGLEAARVFLASVGAEGLSIPDEELPAAMGRLGRTLKSMIIGLREILMTRTSIKSEFRIEQTMVSAGGNNPLKFSVSPEQAMVKPTVRGYLPAEEAAAQALEDIKAHEIAMVTGMEAALKGVLAKLDPAALTQKIEAKGGFGGFLKNRKAQYWETYEAMYAEISDQAQNDFHELFAREFARAYKDQLARLKAEGRKN